MSVQDLTQVPGIGLSRAKFLNEAGIKTIQDLLNMPIEEFAAIKTIGMKNARTIKERLKNWEGITPEEQAAVAETIPEPDQPIAEQVYTPPVEKNLIEEIVQLIDPKTFKAVRKAKSSLQELQDVVEAGLENLKPLGRKKWVKEYVNYKILAKKINKTIRKTLGDLEDFPRRTVKKIFKNSEDLSNRIQELWGQIKRKRFANVNKEMAEFRKLIKQIQEEKKEK